MKVLRFLLQIHWLKDLKLTSSTDSIFKQVHSKDVILSTSPPETRQGTSLQTYHTVDRTCSNILHQSNQTWLFLPTGCHSDEHLCSAVSMSFLHENYPLITLYLQLKMFCFQLFTVNHIWFISIHN